MLCFDRFSASSIRFCWRARALAPFYGKHEQDKIKEKENKKGIVEFASAIPNCPEIGKKEKRYRSSLALSPQDRSRRDVPLRQNTQRLSSTRRRTTTRRRTQTKGQRFQRGRGRRLQKMKRNRAAACASAMISLILYHCSWTSFEEMYTLHHDPTQLPTRSGYPDCQAIHF